jgi:hypothetical protein
MRYIEKELTSRFLTALALQQIGCAAESCSAVYLTIVSSILLLQRIEWLPRYIRANEDDIPRRLCEDRSPQ